MQGYHTSAKVYHPPTPRSIRRAARLRSAAGTQISRWMREDVLTAVQKLAPVAKDAGLTMSQLAIAWVLQNPNVSSAIMGATKPSQVRENVKAAGVKLDVATMKAIDKALGKLPEMKAAETVSPNPRA